MRPYNVFLMSHLFADARDESAPQQHEGEDDARVLAWPARGAIYLIGLYQRYVSPYTPPSCRFYPTCSCYTREAITRFGLLRGGALGAWRILRCNPMCQGGDDPVPLKIGEPKTPASEITSLETEIALSETETPLTIAAPKPGEKAPPREPR